MKSQLAAALATLRSRAAALPPLPRRHRLWAGCAALALVGVAASVWVGRASLERAAALQERAALLERTLVQVERWTGRLQRPGAHEAAAWRGSEQALRSLGTPEVGALDAAQVLAQRAEQAGVANLHIRMATPDSLGVPTATALGSWRIESGSSGLVAEFDGDWPAVIALLGSLPPRLRAASLQVGAAGSALHARLLLATRTAARAE